MGIHEVEKKDLCAKGFLTKIRYTFNQVPEPKKDSRGLKSNISTADCLMSALALFGLKFPSLLQFDEHRKSDPIKHNLETLYQVTKVPCDTNMRQRLDEVDPRALRSAFTGLFSQLQRGKVFEQYKFLDDYLLIACDGTGIFSSGTVHCDNCCQKHHKDGTTTYYHQMLAGVIIHPDHKEVFPLCPEPISNSDGNSKNDCEQNAMQRLLQDFKKEHPHLKAIFTEDALSAKGPYLKRIKEIGASFIVNVNKGGNPTLFEWLKGVNLEKKRIQIGKETFELQFYNGVPLNDSNHDFEVNFIDCIVRNSKGEMKSHFSGVTDIKVTQDNVLEIVKGGKARWKIENETFNTLKNQGYQFEHNFGHGYKNLCHVFGILIFLAFFIDQAQQRCCGLFQKALKTVKRKTRLWNKLRNLFTDFFIESWVDMYDWIANGKGIHLKNLLNSP